MNQKICGSQGSCDTTGPPVILKSTSSESPKALLEFCIAWRDTIHNWVASLNNSLLSLSLWRRLQLICWYMVCRCYSKTEKRNFQNRSINWSMVCRCQWFAVTINDWAALVILTTNKFHRQISYIYGH